MSISAHDTIEESSIQLLSTDKIPSEGAYRSVMIAGETARFDIIEKKRRKVALHLLQRSVEAYDALTNEDRLRLTEDIMNALESEHSLAFMGVGVPVIFTEREEGVMLLGERTEAKIVMRVAKKDDVSLDDLQKLWSASNILASFLRQKMIQ